MKLARIMWVSELSADIRRALLEILEAGDGSRLHRVRYQR